MKENGKENGKENAMNAEDAFMKEDSRWLSDELLDLVSGSVKAGDGTMIPVHKE